MAQEIRILLVDDHSLFRDSLSRLLQTEPGFRMVGSCATVAEALPIIASANNPTSFFSITIWAKSREPWLSMRFAKSDSRGAS